MFFQNFGIWQILIILLLVLILFGVGKLPEVGRGLGRAIREFRSNVGGDDATAPSTSDDSTKKATDKTSS